MQKLHELVQWIGICDGNMQEGSFRCDVNVSVRPKGTTELGTRREIKNLNSFKFMQQAIVYETQWQIETLEDGGKIEQATILFNPDTGETRAMRSKEEANDYRYFPDPDLLPLEVTEEDKASIRAEMPELPEAMQARLESDFSLSSYDASTLTASRDVASYFERVIEAGGDAKLAANWVMGGITAKLNAEDKTIADSPIDASGLAQLIKRISDGTISNNAAKQVFEAMWSGNQDVDAIIEEKGLKQVSDSGAIEAMVDEVLAANANMVEEYKAGKQKLLMPWLVKP